MSLKAGHNSMGLESHLDNQDDKVGQQIRNYINALLNNERLMFCPLVRSFLKFDKGTNVKSITPRAASYTTIAFGMTSNIFKPAAQTTPKNN